MHARGLVAAPRARKTQRITLALAVRYASRVTAVVPEMRASHVQQNVKSLSLLGEPARSEVLARVRPETLQTIEQAHRLGWLPLEVDVEITEAVDTLGRGKNRDWSRSALLASVDGPLVRPFVERALNVFGTAASAYLRLLPRGYPLIYRGAGLLRAVEQGPTAIDLVLDDAPAIVVASRAYQDGYAGAFEAAYVLGKVDGTIDITADAAASRVTFACRWSER